MENQSGKMFTDLLFTCGLMPQEKHHGQSRFGVGIAVGCHSGSLQWDGEAELQRSAALPTRSTLLKPAGHFFGGAR